MSWIDYKELATLVLDSAHEYANKNSTCCKVKVGSCIIPNGDDSLFGLETFKHAVYGCNHGYENCKENGCRRIRLYGEASKEHRLPSDCDSIHSEIDSICRAASKQILTKGATIFVTRYPCEACARAIVAAGIKKVVYGRKESISEYTAEIFSKNEVKVEKIKGWEREDNNE